MVFLSIVIFTPDQSTPSFGTYTKSTGNLLPLGNSCCLENLLSKLPSRQQGTCPNALALTAAKPIPPSRPYIYWIAMGSMCLGYLDLSKYTLLPTLTTQVLKFSTVVAKYAVKFLSPSIDWLLSFDIYIFKYINLSCRPSGSIWCLDCRDNHILSQHYQKHRWR